MVSYFLIILQEYYMFTLARRPAYQHTLSLTVLPKISEFINYIYSGS